MSFTADLTGYGMCRLLSGSSTYREYDSEGAASALLNVSQLCANLELNKKQRTLPRTINAETLPIRGWGDSRALLESRLFSRAKAVLFARRRGGARLVHADRSGLVPAVIPVLLLPRLVVPLHVSALQTARSCTASTHARPWRGGLRPGAVHCVVVVHVACETSPEL